MGDPIKPRKDADGIVTDVDMGGGFDGAALVAQQEAARKAINDELARLGRPVMMNIDGGKPSGGQQTQSSASNGQMGGNQGRKHIGTADDAPDMQPS